MRTAEAGWLFFQRLKVRSAWLFIMQLDLKRTWAESPSTSGAGSGLGKYVSLQLSLLDDISIFMCRWHPKVQRNNVFFIWHRLLSLYLWVNFWMFRVMHNPHFEARPEAILITSDA